MQNSSNIKRRDFIICPHGTYLGQDWDLHYCSIAHFFVVFWWKKISHGSLKSCIVLKPLYIPKQHYLHWCGSLFSGHMQNDPDKRFQWWFASQKFTNWWSEIFSVFAKQIWNICSHDYIISRFQFHYLECL